MKYLKCFILLCLVSLIGIAAYGKAQAPAKTQSLESSIQEIKEDSIGVEMLLALSKESMGSDVTKALELAMRASEIANQLDNINLEIKVKNQIGNAHFAKGSYRKATEAYAELLKAAVAINDLESIAKGHAQLGNIRLVMEDNELAEKHITRARDTFLKLYGTEEMFPIDLKLHLFNNLGVMYSGLGKYDDAYIQFEKGLEVAETNSKYVLKQIQLLNNIGDVFFKKDMPEKAKPYYEAAMDRLKVSPNVLFESTVSLSLGKLYMKLEQPQLAKAYFLKGYSLAESGGGNSHLKHLSEHISKAYAVLGKSDSALIYLKLSQAYMDSLNLVKSSERILEEELFFEFDQEKSELQLFYAKNKLYFYILIFSLILVAFFLLIRSYIVHKNLETTIDEKLLIEQRADKTGLENEMLQNQIHLNVKERALMAMNSIQTEKILEQLAVSFENEKGNQLEFEIQEKVGKLIQSLKKNKGENGLTEFEFRFSKVHVDFFEKLSKDFPGLTLNERRLAAFLKLQLTTKEIIGITGQSMRAVELARIRLRKKLELTNSQISLYDFFVDY